MIELNRKSAKLTYASEYMTISFDKLDQDMDMDEFHSLCKKMATAIGYVDENIQERFPGEEDYIPIVAELQQEIIDLKVKIEELGH